MGTPHSILKIAGQVGYTILNTIYLLVAKKGIGTIFLINQKSMDIYGRSEDVKIGMEYIAQPIYHDFYPNWSQSHPP